MTKRYADNLALNLEILALVRGKSDRQSLKDIFNFVANRHEGLDVTEVTNRWYGHIRHNLPQYEQLLEAQQQAAAGSSAALSLAVDNTEKEKEQGTMLRAMLRVAIPSKDGGKVEDSTKKEDNRPIQVKMARKVAINFEKLYHRNEELEAQVKELEAKLNGSVPKEEHEAVQRQLRSAVQEKVELEETLSGIVKFQERRTYTVGRNGQVDLKN